MKIKKLTVKPYLNMKLMPEIAEDTDGTRLYPLYYLITYDRKSNHIKSRYGLFYYSLQDPKLNNLIKFETNLFQKVFEHETDKLKNPFELKGLNAKLDVYCTSIRILLSEYLKRKLKKSVFQTKNRAMFVLNFGDAKFDFGLLYDICKKIFPNINEFISPENEKEIFAYEQYENLYPERFAEYNFPTIVDWKYGSFKSDFEKQLLKKSNSKKVVTEIIGIIDYIITERLKNIIEEK